MAGDTRPVQGCTLLSTPTFSSLYKETCSPPQDSSEALASCGSQQRTHLVSYTATAWRAGLGWSHTHPQVNRAPN